MKKLKKTLLIVSIALFIIFVFYSYLVAKERFTQFDFDTTVKIQDKIPLRADYFFSWLSILGSAEITGLIWLSLVIFTLFKKWFLTAASLLLMPIALALEVFGKTFVYHPGPPYLFYRGVIRFDFFPSHYVHNEYSYPSGHMLRTSFLITFIAILLILKTNYTKQVIFTLPLILLFILIAISRVSLGEHWTTDVIGGGLLGTAFGILSALTIPTKKVVEKQHQED